MRTVRLKIYPFEELSKDVQEVVIKNFYDVNVYDNWEEGIISNFKEEMGTIGFEVEEVKYRGFNAQGDGAMFIGTVSDFTPFYKNIDHRVIKLIANKSITLSCTISHYGRYTHENSMVVSLNYTLNPYTGRIYPLIEDELSKIEESINSLCKKKAKDLYNELEKGYYYLTSNEEVIETIKANEYEFFKDGKLFYTMG